MVVKTITNLERSVASLLRSKNNDLSARSVITEAIIKILPNVFMTNLKKQKNAYSLLCNCLYDFKRVLKFTSAVNLPKEKEQLRALIIINYHGIEKGLSLKNKKPLFGKENIKILMLRLKVYIQLYGYDDTVDICLAALRKYQEENIKYSVDNNEFMSEVNSFLKEHKLKVCDRGGVLRVKKDEILTTADFNLNQFYNSRYSVRQYTSKEVSMELISKAVNMAKKTPSVCNRQSWKAIILNSKDMVRRALKIQNGASGFEDQVNKVIVITSSLSAFQSVGERYQCWIDGGMFAMSVIYALHALGVGTCCLNWGKDYKTDLHFKKSIGIAESETIIMLISVGHLPMEFTVAKSERKELSDIMRIIG